MKMTLKSLQTFGFISLVALLTTSCDSPEGTSSLAPSADAATASAPVTTADLAIDLDDPALVSKGKQLFVLCQACHAIDMQSGMKVGPHLANILSRPATAVEAYAYSPTFSEKAIVWDTTLLDQWLENPAQMVPGNKMSFAGLKDQDSRAAIIAYLSTL